MGDDRSIGDQSSGEPSAGHTASRAVGPPSSKEGGGFSHLGQSIDQLDLFRSRFIQLDLLGAEWRRELHSRFTRDLR